MILLITYDLKKPGRDYSSLHEAIKKAGTWWHHLESVWLIETSASPKAWYDFLAPHLDASDIMFIVEIKKNAWGTLPQSAWDWISQRSF